MKKNFKKFRKKSGTLIPFSYKKDFPIKSKRVFFIKVKKNLSEVIMHIKNVPNI